MTHNGGWNQYGHGKGSRAKSFSPPLPDFIIEASTVMTIDYSDLTLLDSPKLSKIDNSSPKSSTDLVKEFSYYNCSVGTSSSLIRSTSTAGLTSSVHPKLKINDRFKC